MEKYRHNTSDEEIALGLSIDRDLKFISTSEILPRLGVSMSTLNRMIDRGDFPKSAKCFGRLRRWLESDVDKWFKKMSSS